MSTAVHSSVYVFQRGLPCGVRFGHNALPHFAGRLGLDFDVPLNFTRSSAIDWACRVLLTCLPFSDLSATVILSVDATETQLSVTWSPADGDFDGYVLTCWSDSQTVHSPETTELNAACEGLQAGTLHTITVSTVKSGWEPVESSPTTASTSKLTF